MLSRLGCTRGSLPSGFWVHLCQLSQACRVGVSGGSRHCRPAPQPPSPTAAPSSQLRSREPQLDQLSSLFPASSPRELTDHCQEQPPSSHTQMLLYQSPRDLRFQGTVQRAALLPRDEGWWPQRGPQGQHLSTLPIAHSRLYSLPPGSRKPKGLHFSSERCQLSSPTAISSQMCLLNSRQMEHPAVPLSPD